MSNAVTNDGVESIKINLTFPVEQVNQPLLAHAIRKFGVIADIRRAQIEPETGGYIMLELTGSERQIDDAVAYFKSFGVGVGFIGTDEVQAY